MFKEDKYLNRTVLIVSLPPTLESKSALNWQVIRWKFQEKKGHLKSIHSQQHQNTCVSLQVNLIPDSLDFTKQMRVSFTLTKEVQHKISFK